MKKRLIVAGLVAGAFALTAPALAEEVVVPVEGVGTVTVTNDGGTGGSIVADGDNGNEGPHSGFIAASGDATNPTAGSLCADDNGSPDDGDPENGPESESPTCVEDNVPG